MSTEAASTEEISSETIEFQAEARQLLQLMIHSIYSTKDVFLRELISNSSDALDKLRLAAYQDKELEADTSDLHIALETDPAERTLTVRDNGIGMTRDEVIDLIGTIAKSGTGEMLAKLRQARESGGGSEQATAELIGQFGVGFYSSFMVADRVVLVTRKAGGHTGVRWESSGEGTYTVSELADAPQGTTVTLHLKPEDTDDALHDYTNPSTVRSIVKRYSDFITWPIRMVPAGKGEDGGEGDPEVVNSRKALWARPQSEVSEEEYTEFYHHVSHDWQPPLETIRLSAEGTFEYQALLFLPSHAPMDLFMRDSKRGVQLYVKRVFIMDDCERARSGVPAVRQGRRRRKRPVAEHLPGDPAAGPADPADPQAAGEEGAVDRQDHAGEGAREVRDVLVRTRPSRQGRAAVRLRQPAGDPGNMLVPVDERCREADHPPGVRRADAGGAGQDLLRDRGNPFVAGELAAHGGLQGEGLRGTAADRPGGRGVGRCRPVVRREAVHLDRPRRGRSGR